MGPPELSSVMISRLARFLRSTEEDSEGSADASAVARYVRLGEKRRFARIGQERKPIHYVQVAGKAARRTLANSSGRRSEPTERSRSCEKRICDACRRTSARRSSDGVARECERERERVGEERERQPRESTPGEREGDARRVLESGVAWWVSRRPQRWG